MNDTKSLSLPLQILMGLVMLTWIACEPKDSLPEITVQDFTTTITENPQAGASIGTVIASTSSGSLTYEFTAEEPAGAMQLSPTTGALTVAAPFTFDFEKRERITAVITVKNGSVSKDLTVLILLDDVKPSQDNINTFAGDYRTSRFSWDGIFSMLGSHDCRLDDEMEINPDGTYLYNGGASLCGNEDNQRLRTGTWDMDENLTFVIFDKNQSHEFRANLNFLSDTMIALSGNYQGIPVSGEYVPR